MPERFQKTGIDPKKAVGWSTVEVPVMFEENWGFFLGKVALMPWNLFDLLRNSNIKISEIVIDKPHQLSILDLPVGLRYFIRNGERDNSLGLMLVQLSYKDGKFELNFISKANEKGRLLQKEVTLRYSSDRKRLLQVELLEKNRALNGDWAIRDVLGELGEDGKLETIVDVKFIERSMGINTQKDERFTSVQIAESSLEPDDQLRFVDAHRRTFPERREQAMIIYGYKKGNKNPIITKAEIKESAVDANKPKSVDELSNWNIEDIVLSPDNLEPGSLLYPANWLVEHFSPDQSLRI
jgi:hypothetical protein